MKIDEPTVEEVTAALNALANLPDTECVAFMNAAEATLPGRASSFYTGMLLGSLLRDTKETKR